MSNHRECIIERINKDLNIVRFDNESDSCYKSRIIYSSLSLWIRMVTCSVIEHELSNIKHGKSRRYISNKVEAFFENIIELYPEMREWFDLENMNPVNVIINKLLECGEVVSVGFKTDLKVPISSRCRVSDDLEIYRGLKLEKYEFVTGLTPLYVFSGEDSIEEDVFQFYGVKDKPATKVLYDYMKIAKWNKVEETSYQIFDMHCKDVLSKCWKDDYNLLESEITLYKNAFFDFGFIKKKGNKIYISQISEYFIEKREVRRFMYALKKNNKNQAKAVYKKNNNGEIFELKLFSALPQCEESILFLLGWPKNNITDKYNFYFCKSIWPFIKRIIENLDIILEERR